MPTQVPGAVISGRIETSYIQCTGGPQFTTYVHMLDCAAFAIFLFF